MGGHQLAEWDTLHGAALHRPGIEVFFGNLEPYSSLYRTVLKRDQLVAEHERLQHVLETRGVETYRVEDVFMEGDAAHALRETFLENISVEGHVDTEEREKIRKGKRRTAGFDADHPAVDWDALSPKELFRTLLLGEITVQVEQQDTLRDMRQTFTFEAPMHNLHFMRDQQILTGNGIVLGRLNKAQRRGEQDLIALFWKYLTQQPSYTGEAVVDRIEPPGTVEGGDFLPADEFALIGVSDRTNAAFSNGGTPVEEIPVGSRQEFGAEQLMAKALRHDEVVLVDVPRQASTLHLDMFFNFASDNVAVGCPDIMEQVDTHRYTLDNDVYRLQEDSISFHEYITEWRDFTLAPVSRGEQKCLAANFLTISNGEIIPVDTTIFDDTYTFPQRLHKEYGIDVATDPDTGRPGLSLKQLTDGYGAVHCVTAATGRG